MAHLTAEHLSVFDGDERQDEIAAEQAVAAEQIRGDAKPLESHLDTAAQREAVAAFVAANADHTRTFERAVELSRQETVGEVEERDGYALRFTEAKPSSRTRTRPSRTWWKRVATVLGRCASRGRTASLASARISTRPPPAI